MIANHRLREQIDACREGDGDLALPEMAELSRTLQSDRAVADELAQSRRFDQCVRGALNDLPVPEGLPERLITAIQAAESRSVVNLPAANENQRLVFAQRIRLNRRQVLMAGGGLALVALIAIALSQLGSQRTIAQQELAGEVGRLVGGLDLKLWRPMNGGSLPKGIVVDSAVVGKPVQVQDVSYASAAGWSATVTAIDIAPAGRPRAMLFIVRSSAQFAVPAAPTSAARLGLSDGFTATAWQRHPAGPLYVLVVEEVRGQRLDDYLRKPPVA